MFPRGLSKPWLFFHFLSLPSRAQRREKGDFRSLSFFFLSGFVCERDAVLFSLYFFLEAALVCGKAAKCRFPLPFLQADAFPRYSVRCGNFLPPLFSSFYAGGGRARARLCSSSSSISGGFPACLNEGFLSQPPSFPFPSIELKKPISGFPFLLVFLG